MLLYGILGLLCIKVFGVNIIIFLFVKKAANNKKNKHEQTQANKPQNTLSYESKQT